MSPEEIQQITDALSSVIQNTDIANPKEGSNGYLYVLISVIPSILLLARYFKKAFVTEIKKIVDVQMKQTTDMISIMSMHIEELKHISKEHVDMKESHEEVKEKVETHATWIEQLKDKCA